MKILMNAAPLIGTGAALFIAVFGWWLTAKRESEKQKREAGEKRRDAEERRVRLRLAIANEVEALDFLFADVELNERPQLPGIMQERYFVVFDSNAERITELFPAPDIVEFYTRAKRHMDKLRMIHALRSRVPASAGAPYAVADVAITTTWFINALVSEHEEVIELGKWLVRLLRNEDAGPRPQPTEKKSQSAGN